MKSVTDLVFSSYDGDLRSHSVEDETVFQRLLVPQYPRKGESFNLNSRLNLGVGGDGVIGRKVSLICSNILIAQGIMGWN